jgi:mono/diheme cytochrome c family protein
MALYPPQLFNGHEMVTHNPEGVTFWKVTHGIRLSGMPAFGKSLVDEQRWQVTMLLTHADNLPPSVQSVLSGN